MLQHAQGVDARVVAIDSIQTLVCDEASGRAGSLAQVRECANRVVQFAKASEVACILVGHVTRDGTLAGTDDATEGMSSNIMLELLRRDPGMSRILSCATKNRFGPSNVAGRFTITARGLVPSMDEHLGGGPSTR